MQPSFNKKDIDILEEAASIRRNIELLTQVREDSIKKRELFFSDPSNAIEDEECFFRYARSMKEVTNAYIKKCAANKNSGGVDGMGRLLAHHSLGIVSSGGWVPPENVFNADFSPGTGTAEYMLLRYGLNVSKDTGFLDAISNSAVLKPFGIARIIVAENSFCKDGAQWRQPDSPSNFSESICLGPKSFLIDHKNGAPVKLYDDGTSEQVQSGTTARLDAISNQDSDVRVLQTPNHDYRWWEEGRADITQAFEKSSMKCVLGRQELRRFQGSQGRANGTTKKKRKTLSGNDTVRATKLYAERSKKWGYCPKAPRRVKNLIKEASWKLFNHVLQHHQYTVIGLGSFPSNVLIETAFETFSKDIRANLAKVREEVESMILTFPDADKVDTLQQTSNEWFGKLIRTSPHGRGDDLEDYIQSKDFYNYHFMMAGKRIIPTFSTITNHLQDNSLVIDIFDRLASTLSVSTMMYFCFDPPELTIKLPNT